MKTNCTRLLIALMLAGAATGAGAQQIYKYATPDGATVYTDNPAAGLSGAKKLDMPLALAAVPASFGQATSAYPAAEGHSAAQTELQAARRRRIDGVMPLPGEREGRLFRPEYWQRQRALAQGLVTARAQLSQAAVQH